MTVKQFCVRYNLTEDQFYGREPVGSSLDLRSVTSIPEGFNPTVGSSLYLSSVTSIPEGFNPTVGSSLDLRSVTSIPEGFNPTVGSSLYLSSVTSIPEGFNPTVGRYLDLREYRGPRPNTKEPSYPIIYPNGKYILADGILQHLVSKKGNVYHVRYLTRQETTYLVTDGHGRFAHGDTIKAARDALVYKIGDRDTSQYKGMSLDTVLSYPKAIEAYRVITGACETGVKNFIGRKVGTPVKKYSIKKIIELTVGEYGHDTFRKFFEERRE